jgi:L-alanine-DL-glutamate epimerase-like enolase superfamily enzyme
VEGFWHKAFHGSAMYEPKGAVVAGLSGVDMACWDIMGKATGQPVCKLLGGLNRTEIPAYASDLHWEEDPQVMARAVAGFVERGFRAVKTHVGVDPEDDVHRVHALREAIGPDIGLMVDVNTGFDRPTAIRFGRRVAEFNLTWYEEPLPPNDTNGFAVVRAATGLTIATGENEYTRYGFRDLIQHGAAAILNADANICGGVTEFRRIAALAAAHDLAIAPHGSQDIHIHLLAAIPNGLILEYYRDTVDPMWGKQFKEPLMLDADGMLAPPDRPGFGYEIDGAAIREFRVG